MMTLPISKRLKYIAEQVSKGVFFADIGSDHAYLPCYVCLRDDKARAIAGEVVKGPYINAVETVRQYQLTNQIDVRLGDGLSIINEDESVEEIVIAGMGGTLISNILLEGKSKLKSVQRLIIQPNNKEFKVRETLIELDFILTKELMIEENKLIYEILIAENKTTTERKQPYEEKLYEKQLLFGPYLLREKSPLFIKKWQKERDNVIHTIEQMKRSKSDDIQQKIGAFTKKINWIEEVLS